MAGNSARRCYSELDMNQCPKPTTKSATAFAQNLVNHLPKYDGTGKRRRKKRRKGTRYD